jgi:hypothetical protein
VRGGRIAIIAVLVVSLLLAGLTRDWARTMRVKGTSGSDATGNTSLASMNSFALALLLGGLRGPLVMFLWTQSETLKNEKNLEDFDTYVEWIRLLQPEFDTVHIFQVWNKAYNISVQMASWANKYTTILDAIEYAQRVLQARPGNINMVYNIASIYFDKLGNASEKDYYRRRVREESLPHQTRQRLRREDAGWHRLDLDPVLDAKGNILPELLKPTRPRPADLPKDSEWNDGSELQYLASYQPLPYGVSTFGFAYNYHKQAQVLQDVEQRRHANLSDLVVDSRPALALKGWGEDEWERGRRLEMRAFNVAPPTERRDWETPTADTRVDTPFSERAVIEEASFSYDLSAKLCERALVEYEAHLKRFTMNFSTYQSHMDGLRAQGEMCSADRDYLKAMLASGAERAPLLASARQHYLNAVSGNLLVILRYYTPDELAAKILPAGMGRPDVEKLTPEQRIAAYEKLVPALKTMPYDPDAEDRSDYQRYVDRAMTRMQRAS